jgi:exodeoxyribonuclease VII small subunit
LIVAKKKPAESTESTDPLSFEESLGDLEHVVAQLEGGKLGLAESLAAYEQGVARLNACYQMLERAERKIELVQSVDANGKAKTAPLDDAEEDDLSAKSASRSRRRSAGGAAPSVDRVDDARGLF